jgi:hypothetical protein
LVDGDRFSLGPEYFTFPDTSAYAYKRFDALDDVEQKNVVKLWRAARLKGLGYNGWREAIQSSDMLAQ